MAIEKKVVKSPRMLIFQVISLIQQWRILLPKTEEKLVQDAAKALKLKMWQSRWRQDGKWGWDVGRISDYTEPLLWSPSG
jgi:hypothetical protein